MLEDIYRQIGTCSGKIIVMFTQQTELGHMHNLNPVYIFTIHIH